MAQWHVLGEIHDLESFGAQDDDLRLEEDEVERFRRKEEVLLDKVSFHSPSNIGKAYTL